MPLYKALRGQNRLRRRTLHFQLAMVSIEISSLIGSLAMRPRFHSTYGSDVSIGFEGGKNAEVACTFGVEARIRHIRCLTLSEKHE